jgi:PAS domain S-box-containing protein
MTLGFDDFNDLLHPPVQGATLPKTETSYSRLQYLINNTPAIIYASVPSGDFKMTYVSDNVLHVLGYEPLEMISDPNFWFNHIHPDDAAEIFSSLAFLFTEGHRTYEYRFLSNTRGYIWMHDMLHLVRDDLGNPIEVVGSLTDITARKNMEEDLRHKGEEQQILIKKLQETQHQLLQAEKMASVGQLAAGIAHEINNPIGFVNSNLSSLQTYSATLFRVIDQYNHLSDRLAITSESKQIIAEINKTFDLDFLKEDISDLIKESLDGLKRVRDIVHSLKNFSHVGETDWLEADIHEGIESTLHIVQNEIKYKVSVEKRYGTLPMVQCILSQLNQVFMNLFINAAQAIKDKGIIAINTGTEIKDGVDCVWIKVTDTGVGIPPENLNRIFEPFFTTKPIGSGTGLGLSVAYGIIDKHNGKISVQSAVGKGTRFTIYLPIKQCSKL